MARLAAPIADHVDSPVAHHPTLGDTLGQWATYLRGSDRIGSARTITAYQYG
jgi:hypothetical protein